MKKKIAILGSTGTIGKNLLNISGIVTVNSAEHANSLFTNPSDFPVAIPLLIESKTDFIFRVSPGNIFLLNFALFKLKKLVLLPEYFFWHKKVMIND